jgi:hypothetical protein
MGHGARRSLQYVAQLATGCSNVIRLGCFHTIVVETFDALVNMRFESSKMTERHHAHWFSPASMLATWLAALAFALGHHFFYDNLDGEYTPSGNHFIDAYDTGVSKQQMNLAVGTALAFAVKTCLVLAASTAYVQLFWKVLISQPSSHPFHLQSIDKAYSALRNATLLIDYPSWKRFPLLFSLALTTWYCCFSSSLHAVTDMNRLLPIASIITPATLSIESQRMDPSPVNHSYVPTINFDSLSYVAGLGVVPNNRYSPSEFQYEGPSQALKRIAAAVGSLGAILPIDAPSTNASWQSNFSGPAIRCGFIPDSEQLPIQRNIAEYVNSSSVCYTPPGYIAWFGDLPYSSSTPTASDGQALKDAEPVVTANGWTQATEPSFRIAIIPELLTVIPMSTRNINPACSSGWGSDPEKPLDVNNATMLRCQLVNSTYETAFRYPNGNQAVTTNNPPTSVEEPVPVVSLITGPTNTSCVGLSAGYLSNFSPGGGLTESDIDWPERCDFDPYLPRRLAYRSILDAFFNIISGPVALDQTNGGNVLSTTLLETRELHFLSNYARAVDTISTNTWNNAQVALIDSGRGDIAGLTIPKPENERPLLASELERMFKNLTVSLMSSQTFH